MIWTDHLGNTFKSAKALCSYHNMPLGVFDHRMRNGWSIEQALTVKPSRFCKDHLGNVYNTKSEMCNAYDINLSIFNSRIKRGISLKNALTKPSINSNSAVTNCLGIHFKSRSIMFKHYGITSEKFKKRMKKNWSELETLEIIPRINAFTSNTKLFDDYIILKHINNDYYECLINNQSIVKTYDSIISDCIDYFKKH